MNICHVITRMIVGGAQENTLCTLRGHLEAGYDTTLVTGPSDGPEGKLLDQQPLAGLRVVELPDLVRPIHPWHDLKAYLALKKLFKEESFDIVHTHSTKAGVLGRVAARRAGVPVVVHTIHGPSFHRFLPAWKNKLYIASERFASRYGDRTFAVAQAMIDQYVEAGVTSADTCQVVYSGMELGPCLNCEPDADLRERLEIPAGVPVIGKVARLFELKGYEQLMQAAPKIAEEMPDAHFLIVGDGLLRARIDWQVRDLRLGDRFHFAGLVKPSEVHRYVALMDVLVHLSLREGLPRVVVQGLACGKPVVGFDLDGTPEAVQDGQTGYICPPEDSDAAAEAVPKLLRDPEQAKKMGAKGREFVRRRWDWEYMARTLEHSYGQLLAHKSGAPPAG